MPSANSVSIEPTTMSITSVITWKNRWDHFLARWGINRMGHIVEPGLYRLGDPNSESPVFVTANYTLSFDALRSVLTGIDCFILVLDTQGINVWCAAGKGTFGTDELVHRIEDTKLQEIVSHRVLILPQLGAPGVSAHKVRKRSGFKVEYGPIRASDLPEYLKTRQATLEMRRIRFPMQDRLVLVPVELVHYTPHLVLTAIGLFFVDGLLASLGIVSAILMGLIGFPLVLPWLPTRAYSTKGFILGGLNAIPFALEKFTNLSDAVLWLRTGSMLTYLLALPPVTAYLALNFTGSTPWTSQSGVKREIFTFVPIMVAMIGISVALTIIITLY